MVNLFNQPIIVILILIIGAVLTLQSNSLNQLAVNIGVTRTWLKSVICTALVLTALVLLGLQYFLFSFSRATSGI